MNLIKLAVLLTCHNRKDKTISCLKSFYEAAIPNQISYEVFLVDDNSNDGTAISVINEFPTVKLHKGSGNLYWAGGMRFAWKKALEKNFDAFLLLNDDVILKDDFLRILVDTLDYSVKTYGKEGIYCGATTNIEMNKITYGGWKITNKVIYQKLTMINPNKVTPQLIDLANANILWISASVVSEIGIFNERYIHGIADFDYSLQAHRNNIPVLLAPQTLGLCNNDHGSTWKASNVPLIERIRFLKSPTGLAYRDYLFFVRRHFPFSLPIVFILLWGKTLFPILWEKFKKHKVLLNE